MTGRVFARNAGSAFLFLPKEAPDGRLDALFLGCFVEGVLAAVAAAGVAALAVLQPRQTVPPTRREISEEEKQRQNSSA